jgi:hypothetical protein
MGTVEELNSGDAKMRAEALRIYCEASELAHALRNALHRSGRRPAVEVAGIAVAALAATLIRGGLSEEQFAAYLRSALTAPGSGERETWSLRPSIAMA